MPHSTVEIETPDGRCPTEVFTPEGSGPWPAAIVFMDAFGMRPAVMELGERLASAGYVALVPNIFYRIPPVVFDPHTAFSDPVTRADLMGRVIPSAGPANAARDMEGWLAWLGTQPYVVHGPIGLVGYCMGGRLALSMAGRFGERIAAAASYHGGGLATDSPESPHLLAPRIRARVYVAGATQDRSFDDAQKARLEHALTEAGVDHRIETYPARHGWVLRDTAEHDEAQTERHWQTLLDLFGETLGGARVSAGR